jgi:hypothetical protein
MFDLKPLKVSNSYLLLGTPWKGRIIFFGFALLLGSMMVVNAKFSLVPSLLVLIAVLAGFYTEVWQFDLDRQLVIHTEGLLFLNRKKSFAFREVVRVELRNSRTKGSATRTDFEPEPPSFSSPLSKPSATPDQPLQQDPPNRIRGKGFSGLFLIFSDGMEVNVHTTSIKKAQEQAALGRLISGVCQKPFSTYV